MNPRRDRTRIRTKLMNDRDHEWAVILAGGGWNDLGEPRRVMASLNMAGVRPRWLDVPQYA